MSGFIILNAKRGLTRMSSNATRQSVTSFWQQLKELSQKEAGDVVEITLKRNSNNVKGTLQLREGINPKDLQGIGGFFRRLAETLQFMLSRFKPASKAEIAGKNPFINRYREEAQEAADKSFIKFSAEEPGLKATQQGAKKAGSATQQAGQETAQKTSQSAGAKAAPKAVNIVKLTDDDAAAVAKLIATPKSNGKMTTTLQNYISEALNTGKARMENGRLVMDADFVPKDFSASNAPKAQTPKLFDILKTFMTPDNSTAQAMGEKALEALGQESVERLTQSMLNNSRNPLRNYISHNLSIIKELLPSGKLNEVLAAGAKATA